MLTQKFDLAFQYAHDLHRGQTRKGTAVPYISHLMAVASLVLEHGGDEDQAIAALLHDAVEDQGGLDTARAISARFGPKIAQLVLACTDQVRSAERPKLGWRERKGLFIQRLSTCPRRAVLVITCDKVHNLSCIIADVQREGPDTLRRFSRPASITWYYASIAHALAPFAAEAPVDELQARVDVLTGLVPGHDLPQGSDLHD